MATLLHSCKFQFFVGFSGMQQASAPSTVTSLVTALTFPMLYGDERDAIVAKWNQLQASWGTGKGYYDINQPPVEFTPENPFCCFKVNILSEIILYISIYIFCFCAISKHYYISGIYFWIMYCFFEFSCLKITIF